MARKLKVYATRIGFHDTVVASPSQKAALAAWDVRENLFAQGAAAPTDDPGAIKAATARPGVVLRRAAGSDRPFSEAPAAPDVPKVMPPTRASPTDAKPVRKPAAPDRRALDAAERALAALAQDENRARDDLARRRRGLEAEEARSARELDRRRASLERELDRARRAFEREGG